MGLKDLLGGAVSGTNAAGGLLGSGLSNHTLDASQYAAMSNQINMANARITRDVPMSMVQSGDVIIRPVRNGYNVIVVRGMGMEAETYVATDADHLADVIKLAFVNRAMDAAK